MTKMTKAHMMRKWIERPICRLPGRFGYHLKRFVSAGDIEACKQQVAKVVVDEKIRRYVVELASATRTAPEIALGASTRAEVLLMLASRALAAFEGSEFVTPDHVKALLAPAFRHRLILRPEAEVGGQTPDSVLEAVASRVVPPR